MSGGAGDAGKPSADVSVRVAWADDAAAIAAVQIAAWPALYADLLPTDAFPTDAEVVAAAWHQALGRPADARMRVLVALVRNTVVGFVLTAPASDPDCDQVADAEMTDLTVHPDRHGQGHGSRLLQAAVDTMSADRFSRAVCWVNAADDALRSFLADAGWAPDGAHRELDLDGQGQTTVKQVRLHCSIAD